MAVWRAAEATIDTLRELGMEDTCIIGGMAANLYGNDREPEDVDVLILDGQYDQRYIRRMITRKNPCFYLLDAITPGAFFKVLWYHPHGEASIGHHSSIKPIKIDILLPGDAKLPSFHPSQIVHWNVTLGNSGNSLRLPTAPLLLVLLHKVLGWWTRRRSSQDHIWEKHMRDALDVVNLLPIASRRRVRIHDNVLPDDFLESASEWVREFIATYPNHRAQYHWGEIGFKLA